VVQNPFALYSPNVDITWQNEPALQHLVTILDGGERATEAERVLAFYREKSQPKDYFPGSLGVYRSAVATTFLRNVLHFGGAEPMEGVEDTHEAVMTVGDPSVNVM